MSDLPEGTLTYLLTDIRGSTSSWESDPERMSLALARHDGIMAAAVGENGGLQVEAGREGDSVLAVFKAAADAAQCAIELQRAFRAADWPGGVELKVRIALHTGEAHLRGAHYYGPALNRCARVLALCHPGQILVTRSTWELLADAPADRWELRDLGQHRLRDLRRSEHLFQLTDPSFPIDFPATLAAGTQLTNLPTALNRFIGREDQLAELRRLAGETRLLTLVGPGGAGKTRLATELAAELVPAVRDGVWMIDLAPVSDPLLVPRAAAAALDVSEQPGRPLLETLIEYCAERELVLVLDNCEHLIERCAELCERFLRSCPRLRVIATSREPLNIAGEVARAIPPLSAAEAVSLFADRAQTTASEFRLTDTMSSAVAEICRRLDGIPLAIELAAARVIVMTPQEIVRHMDSETALLGGGRRTAAPRQQTLEAAIDWSYQLLSGPERMLFRRLAVFAGSFSFDAVRQVCDGSLELLAQLIAKSLVQRQDDRYRLLDTIRAFAASRLELEGEIEAIRTRHAAYCMAVASDRQAGELAAWLERVGQEQDNLRAALTRLLAADPAAAAALAHSLYLAWLGRGQVNEARLNLRRIIEALGPDHPALPTAQIDAAAFAYTAGDFVGARSLVADAQDSAVRAGDASVATRARLISGVIDIGTGDVGGATAALAEARESPAGKDDASLRAELLHHLGVLASLGADRQQARRLFAESLALRTSLGRRDEASSTLTFLAAVALLQQDLDTAHAALKESLELALEQRDRRSAWALDVLGCLAVARDAPERGIGLAGAAAQLFEATGQRPPAAWRERVTQPVLDQARAQIGDEAADKAWEAGRAFSFEESLYFALAGMEAAPATAAAASASRTARSRS